jgi:RsiW-degrading membrane proteinase PrsW (M82 family)
MGVALIVPLLLCLLPVLGLLATLVVLDSYALMPGRVVAAMLGIGVAMALASYGVNGWLMRALGLSLQDYSRYLAPPIEEALKASLIVWLIHRHRIGFLIDAAITGFALGCGFAVVENLYAIWRIPDAGVSTWIVRGFGTAIMHGGASAAFALVSLAILEQNERHGLLAVLPGFVVAVLLHAFFNHIVREPVVATCVMLVAVPMLLMLAWHRGEASLIDWLGRGFDGDTERLASIESGRFAESPAGRYLASLRARFQGPVVADMLCYLRLFTELSLRAKGMLMMRENGFEPSVDDSTRASVVELGYLEKAIGPTGLMVLQPLLPMRRKALRQLYLA